MKVIAELDVSDNKKLILSIGKFQERERIDLRQYIKVDDKFIITRKGVNFDSEWLPDFVKMVRKLEDEWVGIGYIARCNQDVRSILPIKDICIIYFQ